MTKEFKTISDGVFTLQETRNKNQFFFYRNDGDFLKNVDKEPMYFYQIYITKRILAGEITGTVMNNFYTDISDDGKYIRLTVSDLGEKTLDNNNSIVSKKPSFWKNFLNKILR